MNSARLRSIFVYVLIVVAIVVLLFGATQLPKLAKALGRAKAAFEEGAKEKKRRDDRSADRDGP